MKIIRKIGKIVQSPDNIIILHKIQYLSSRAINVSINVTLYVK